MKQKYIKENKKLKVYYISNILPEQVCNALSGSIAGNKYSIAICKSINEIYGDDFDVISLSGTDTREIKELSNNCIWAGKTLYSIKNGKTPFISEFAQSLRLCKFITKKSSGYADTVIFINNSPGFPSCALLLTRFLCNAKIYSITIDTPFASTNTYDSLYGMLIKGTFKLGYWALKFFDGIIVHHKDALHEIGTNIPYLEVVDGFIDDPSIDNDEWNPHETIKAVYTGTLISYNCINEMIEAFTNCGNRYELHIYGYGPLEDDVIKAAKENQNIVFHGRINNDKIISTLADYDILLNIRKKDVTIENFAFPSKIVEYILSKRPVLTTYFKTMPNEYESFLHMAKDSTPEAIIQAITIFSEMSFSKRKDMCEKAYKYVKENQRYSVIVDKIMKFATSSLNEVK